MNIIPTTAEIRTSEVPTDLLVELYQHTTDYNRLVAIMLRNCQLGWNKKEIATIDSQELINFLRVIEPEKFAEKQKELIEEAKKEGDGE